MYFFVVFLSFVGLVFAAPVDVNTAPEEFKKELQKSFQPVVADVRTMLKNAETGIKDFANAAVESKNNILEAGKEFLSPIEEKDRANIRNPFAGKFRSLNNRIKEITRQLIQRALHNSKPVVQNEKAAVNNYKNAIQNLENKYLSEDGQDLVRKLTG